MNTNELEDSDELSSIAKKQERFRKKNKHIRSMFNKIVRWFAQGVFPKDLEYRFRNGLNPKELQIFNQQLSEERYKISKRQRSF